MKALTDNANEYVRKRSSDIGPPRWSNQSEGQAMNVARPAQTEPDTPLGSRIVCDGTVSHAASAVENTIDYMVLY